jgi:hypothetical protein
MKNKCEHNIYHIMGIDSLLSDRNIVFVFIALLIAYCVFGYNKLPAVAQTAFEQPLFRGVYMLLAVTLVPNYPQLALMLILAYIVTLIHNNSEPVEQIERFNSLENEHFKLVTKGDIDSEGSSSSTDSDMSYSEEND